MAKVETISPLSVSELELPPEGGNLSVVSTLEEDAKYLRVTLDKSENFKVVAGKKLVELLQNKFGNNRNALRDWYEDNVVQGKAHRAWATVEKFLGTVLKHGAETAADVFSRQREEDRKRKREQSKAEQGATISVGDKKDSENNDPIPIRQAKSEYDLRRAWLSDMNHLWFKGDREWQDRWLKDRSLSRDREL